MTEDQDRERGEAVRAAVQDSFQALADDLAKLPGAIEQAAGALRGLAGAMRTEAQRRWSRR
jgi:hypothetical protein